MMLPSNGARQLVRAVSTEAYQYTGSSDLIAGPTNSSNISDVINPAIIQQNGRATIHAFGFHRHNKYAAMPTNANGARISPSGGSLSITSNIIKCDGIGDMNIEIEWDAHYSLPRARSFCRSGEFSACALNSSYSRICSAISASISSW